MGLAVVAGSFLLGTNKFLLLVEKIRVIWYNYKKYKKMKIFLTIITEIIKGFVQVYTRWNYAICCSGKW